MRKKIVPILKKHEVVKAGFFGSFARGEKYNDIDILIKMKGRKSYFDLVQLKFELEDNFKKKFDLVSYKYIYKPIKKQILREEIRII